MISDRLKALFLALAADNDRAEQITAEEVIDALNESFPPERRADLMPQALAFIEAPPMDLPGIDWHDGAYHPVDVEQVRQVVRSARQTGRRVRVAGAQHSAASAIYSRDPRDVRVVLAGALRNAEITAQDADSAVVLVGAGRYLGVNPADPTSTPGTSLNAWLDERGFALPILGGISHQTVAGFLQTSSAGGSTRHGFASAIQSIELVDGTGTVRWVHVGTDDFHAAGVSMGLFGIITHVVLSVRRRYFVAGAETNHEEADSVLVKKNGRYLLRDVVTDTDTDYFHANWFPQRRVRRVTQWTGTRRDPVAQPDPYKSDLKSGWMNVLAAFVLALTNGVLTIDPHGPIAERIIGALLRKFVSLKRRETFNDRWFTVLPCDDQARVDTLIKVIFTEIWLPLDQLEVAIDRLRAAVEDQAVAGNFAIELYGAEESPFWLSPSTGRDVIRVDVFWWAHNIGDPRSHFAHYWDALLELNGARLHWGKHLPDVGARHGKVVFNAELLASRYPQLPNWLARRRVFDPDGVFLTEHWRRIFGL